MAKPTPDELDREAQALRDQARALHHTVQDEIQTGISGAGGQNLAMARQQAAAHAEADLAAKQATGALQQATDYSNRAAELDKAAAQAAARGDTVDAEENREAAQNMRAAAAGSADQAQQAEEAARQLNERAARLDEYHDDPTKWHDDNVKAEAAADALEDKARMFSEAAKSEREAVKLEAEGNVGGAAGSRNYADYALEQAASIQPDLSGVNPAMLHSAGIQMPGAPTVTDPATDPAGGDDGVDGDGEGGGSVLDRILEKDGGDESEPPTDRGGAPGDGDARSDGDGDPAGDASPPAPSAPAGDESGTDGEPAPAPKPAPDAEDDDGGFLHRILEQQGSDQSSTGSDLSGDPFANTAPAGHATYADDPTFGTAGDTEETTFSGGAPDAGTGLEPQSDGEPDADVDAVYGTLDSSPDAAAGVDDGAAPGTDLDAEIAAELGYLTDDGVSDEGDAGSGAGPDLGMVAGDEATTGSDLDSGYEADEGASPAYYEETVDDV